MDALSAQLESAIAEIVIAPNLERLEALRVSLLGKNGLITEQLKTLGKLAPDERKVRGEQVNRTKEQLHAAISKRKAELEESAVEKRLSEERMLKLAAVVKKAGAMATTALRGGALAA